ncbi:uncharacterized protein LOC115631859 [Scaptodrosophila lebanonensis]|uniref:Uncharacterized protein LOC115631859 n=1 Tax=Drosophila lebanonensis TaxID=7225 RepID=A0A6J2UBJ0_DROLE|nr:uncharacterized protein LOC115631859 [Scaptodrosophila lebanonensis]
MGQRQSTANQENNTESNAADNAATNEEDNEVDNGGDNEVDNDEDDEVDNEEDDEVEELDTPRPAANQGGQSQESIDEDDRLIVQVLSSCPHHSVIPHRDQSMVVVRPGMLDRQRRRTRWGDGMDEVNADPLHEARELFEKDLEEERMKKFLEQKLERDKLPEDTPLPIFLQYREPKAPFVPSVNIPKRMHKKHNPASLNV